MPPLSTRPARLYGTVKTHKFHHHEIFLDRKLNSEQSWIKLIRILTMLLK